MSQKFCSYLQIVSKNCQYLRVAYDGRACVRNLDLRLQSVLYIQESSGPQNQWVQKVMSQRSAGSCTYCTRANAFPGWYKYGKLKLEHIFKLTQCTSLCDLVGQKKEPRSEIKATLCSTSEEFNCDHNYVVSRYVMNF